MKSRITVVGAAIVREGKLLAFRRAYGNEEVIHKFEFVGGKVEEGETPEQALIRECKEELALEIEVGELLNTFSYDYPDSYVRLSVYFVKPLSDYKLTVHDEARWFDCNNIDTSEWAPADKEFLGTLKTGYFKIYTAESEEQFKTIHSIATEVMHETYDATTAEGQIDYMIERNLIPEAISKNIKNSGYIYKLIYLNGEAAGFFAYCPAKNYREDLGEGVYLSKVYIKKFARGKKLATKVFANLPRPVYLTVKRDNGVAMNVYKHLGFKILENIKTDIGNGYILDDFLMTLNK